MIKDFEKLWSKSEKIETWDFVYGTCDHNNIKKKETWDYGYETCDERVKKRETWDF